MQSVSSRIWTRVAVSISYDDSHYTTGTLNELQLISLLTVKLSTALLINTNTIIQYLSFICKRLNRYTYDL